MNAKWYEFLQLCVGPRQPFREPACKPGVLAHRHSQQKTGEITPPVLLGDWQGGEITSCRVRDSLCRSSCRLWRLYRDLERFAANLGADGGEEEVHAAIRR